MNTTVSAKTLKPTWEPYQAAAWLVRRHDHAQHILDRVDCWATEEGNRFPDLQKLAEGINAADQYGVEWKAYEYSHPAPRANGFLDDDARDEVYERAYDAWEKAGPEINNDVATAYLPMSSGEKRLLRVLAIFAPAVRVQFHLDDTDGISLRCCSPDHFGGTPPHRSFLDDWRDLISERVMVP